MLRFDDHVVVYAVENQGVVRWATVNERVDDAPVYVDRGDFIDIEPNWDRYADSVRDFITRFCIRELVFEAPFPNVDGIDTWIDKVVVDTEPMIDAYTDDSSRSTPVWMVDDVLVMGTTWALPGGEERTSWYFGAKSELAAGRFIACYGF